MFVVMVWLTTNRFSKIAALRAPRTRSSHTPGRLETKQRRSTRTPKTEMYTHRRPRRARRAAPSTRTPKTEMYTHAWSLAP